MRKIKRWWRRRRFITAYVILYKESERHKEAGHNVEFSAINESSISMVCLDCPELQP